LIENKGSRKGDWRIVNSERMENINTGMRTKGSHLKDEPVNFLLGGSV